MEKRFIGADEFLADCWELARRIQRSGWRPTHVVGVWRGGAAAAVAVQEWLAAAGVATDHCAVRTKSYAGIGEQTAEVTVDGLDYLVRVLRPESRLLLVDDIHDSGRSLAALIAALQTACGAAAPQDIRRATVFYHPDPASLVAPPDYHVHESTCWIVFPHELLGLTPEEMRLHRPAALACTAAGEQA